MKGSSIAVSLILVPMTLEYVSSEIYGVWLTLSSVIHWLSFMDVGFSLGLKNRLAEALAKGNYVRGKSLVSTTYFMMVAIFVPLSIALVVVSPSVEWCDLLNINQAYHSEVLHTVQLLFVFIAMQMIVNVLVAVSAAYQQVALSSSFNVVGQILALISIFVMTKFLPSSLPNLTLAYSLMPIVVTFIFSLVLYNGRFKTISPTICAVNFKYVKDLWNLGAKFFVIQVQVIVLYQTTNFLISYLDGPEAVTQYNIAYKVLNVAAMTFTIILGPLWPAFTDAYTKNDYVWMNRIYRKMCFMYCGVFVAISVIMLLSPYIYQFWVDDKVSVPFLLTMTVAVYIVIQCWNSLQVLLINGIGTVKLQTYVTLVGLIFHIPLSLFLGRLFGVIGVIISMCAINLVYAVFFTLQMHRLLNQKASGLWKA